MKGLKCLKNSKNSNSTHRFNCFVRFLLVSFCAVFAGLSSTSSVSALDAINYSYYSATGNGYSWHSVNRGASFSVQEYVMKIEPHFSYSGGVSGNAGVIQDKIWLTTRACNSSYLGRLINSDQISVIQVVVNYSAQQITSQSITASMGPVHDYYDGGCPSGTAYYQTLTLNVQVQFRNNYSGSNPSIYYTVGSENTAFYYNPYYSLLAQPPQQQLSGEGSVAFSDNISNALLETQVEQNNTIINELGDISDTITDSSVDGDFSITTVQAFGPLGTIVNNLVAFVGDLLSIGSSPCQPLKPPLPQYAGGGTLDISCPSSFMQPYKVFTDALDVIIAAYLWFKIAIYIYHSVENLRNPENDDEEFLEL